MGSYISLGRCQSYYGIMPNCSITIAEDKKTILRVGEFGRGEFPGEPDIGDTGVRALRGNSDPPKNILL